MRYLFSPECPDQGWGPLALLFSGYWGVFTGISWPQCKVDHLLYLVLGNIINVSGEHLFI